MTPEAQRIAIAKALGYPNPRIGAFNRCYAGESPLLEEVPDYLNDLNAMAHVEQSLSPKDRLVYGEALATWHADFHDDYYAGWASYGGMADGFFKLATIPAAKRAETFLKTLHLWTP